MVLPVESPRPGKYPVERQQKSQKLFAQRTFGFLTLYRDDMDLL